MLLRKVYLHNTDLPVAVRQLPPVGQSLWRRSYNTVEGPEIVRTTYAWEVVRSSGLQELTKIDIEEEDLGGLSGPRATAAAKFWKENWWRMVSRPGHGEYLIHHHWRGLLDTEIDKSDRWLIQNTRHSIHEDIRHEVSPDWANGDYDEDLFGLAVFLEVKDLRKAPGNLVAPNTGKRGLQKAYQLAWKLPQPESWIKVGRRRPVVFPPKSIGATTEKFAKFFAVDWGKYHVGVCREHSFELFYKTQHTRNGMRGRYLYTLIEADGRRVWNIRKPEDQTAIASREKPDDLLQELRGKRQKYLVWSDGESKPVVYDVKSGKPVLEKTVRVFKTDMEKGLVYGEVLVPEETDAQGEFETFETIEQTAHDYLMKSRKLDLRHERLIEDNEALLVESYLAPADFEWQDHKVRTGTWIVCVKIFSPFLKKEIITGELQAFSIRGLGTRKEAN